MASFRSGLKILCEFSKKQGQGLLGRSFSADRSAGVGYLRDEGAGEVKRPARSSSWLSLWRREEGQVGPEEAPLVDTSLVCSVPVAPVGAAGQQGQTLAGPVERMFELQEKHLHPKQARRNTESMNEISKRASEAEFKAIDLKDFSPEPDKSQLTPRQIEFIKRLQRTSISPLDDLKTVEPPKQMYTRYKNVELEERQDVPPMPLLHPISVYASLKKILNFSSLNNSQNNLSVAPKRFYSKSIMDPPTNNNNAIECKKKGSDKNKSKGGRPEHCTKVPSGIEGTVASTGECPRYKMPGCKVPKSTDCKPKPVKRAPCVKLEAPMPSYSECVKDPTPPARPTECPREDRGPPAHCLEEKHGFSYDGCNPPREEKPVCIPKERQTGKKKKSKSCTDDKTECDAKPYKEAGAGLCKLPKSCPSASTISGVSEPSLLMKQFLPPKRSYSCSNVEPPNQMRNFLECSSKKCNKKEEKKKKICFKQEKLKKKKKKSKTETSPVSCQMKQDKKNRCDDPTLDRPWRECKKPPALFTHSCPKPKKFAVQEAKRKKPNPCDVPMKTFKECRKPKSTTAIYRCPELGPAPVPPPPRPPPTPKRCVCDDDPKELKPEIVLCRKVRNARKPSKDCIHTEKDCSLKGKIKSECDKCKKND